MPLYTPIAMITFTTSDNSSISIPQELLDRYPDSLLSSMARWGSSPILVQNISFDQLHILSNIYNDIPVPDPLYYSNTPLYQFMDNGLMVDLLYYFMIPLKDVHFLPIPQDEEGDSETERTFTDDFNANWELSSIPEDTSEVSDWSDDEGIWE